MKGLKPCPFCGGEAWLREKTLRLFGICDSTWEKKARIAMYCYCGKCKARGGVATGTYTFVTYITNKDNNIRIHTTLNDMDWLINMVHAYEKLKAYSGYKEGDT